MPELPEVETVRRVIEHALKGKKIDYAEFPEDTIVLGAPPAAMKEAAEGATVEKVGRKGKFWWIELDRKPWIFGHLGMTGWVREVGKDSIRLREHGKAPWDDENGRPRFLKMSLTAEDGTTVVMTDGRRLGRIWLADSVDSNKNIARLGPDMLHDPWKPADLGKILAKRHAPIKALLLDQALFAGIGNWTADEVLYQARIAPNRTADTLMAKDVKTLLETCKEVLKLAVDSGADSDKYPETWLFNTRWGGKKGKKEIGGHSIVRETIGGRTTAWVPNLQK